MPRFDSVMPQLPVADMARAVAFYTEKLGFRVDLCWPDDAPKYAILAYDNVRVGLFVPDEHRRVSGFGAVELAFDVDDVRGLHERLAQHGVVAEWGPQVYFYGRREFAIRDPDGALLIFGEETSDPPTCKEE